MDGMDVSGVSKAMPAWMMDMDQLMAPLDEVEVARVLGLLSSTLLRHRQKYDQKYCEEEDELVYYELLYLCVIARKQIKNMLAPAQPCLQAPIAWIVRKLFDAELFD